MFGIIENCGPNNLRDTLRAEIKKAFEVRIAVAFVTQSGLEKIIQPLREVSVRGKVRLITGLYQCFTEPKALLTLLSIQDKTRNGFSIRLSTEPLFHRKVYLLEYRTQAKVIIGSSNLTREGLESGGELNIMVSLQKKSPFFKELKDNFDKEWKYRSVTPSTKQIREYSKKRPTQNKSYSFTKEQLKSILKTDTSHIKAPPDPVQFWRHGIGGLVKKLTRKIISENTTWDKRGYNWYSQGGSHPYRIRDRIFLIDNVNKHLLLAEVKDFTKTPIPTPDGRHFVAYKPVPNYDRSLTQTLWGILENEGIDKKNYYRRVGLNTEEVKRLMDIIKKRSQRA